MKGPRACRSSLVWAVVTQPLIGTGVFGHLHNVITHPLGTPRFDRFGRVQARVARMTSKGFAPLSRAVSIVVRTSASAFAAHMAR